MSDVVVSPCPRCGKDDWEKVGVEIVRRPVTAAHERIHRRCRGCGKDVYEQGARVR